MGNNFMNIQISLVCTGLKRQIKKIFKKLYMKTKHKPTNSTSPKKTNVSKNK